MSEAAHASAVGLHAVEELPRRRFEVGVAGGFEQFRPFAGTEATP